LFSNISNSYKIIMNSHLVCLPEAVYPPHLALLVRVGEDAHGGLLPRDGEDKVLPALLGNVLPQLTQQTACPLLLHLQLLCYQLLLTTKKNNLAYFTMIVYN
jgi:hypothetical protein